MRKLFGCGNGSHNVVLFLSILEALRMKLEHVVDIDHREWKSCIIEPRCLNGFVGILV